ncbi:MAG TPA: PKD domain-containing protein [Methanoculleus sp.]|nr:PKD domain-containing protein [Methanoculleus sp.]
MPNTRIVCLLIVGMLLAVSAVSAVEDAGIEARPLSLQHDKLALGPRELANESLLLRTEVNLTPGEFVPVGLENVSVNNLTPLGAVHAAAQQGLLTYNAGEYAYENGTPFYAVNRINDIADNSSAFPPIYWGWGNATLISDDFSTFRLTDGDTIAVMYYPYVEIFNESVVEAWVGITVQIAGQPDVDAPNTTASFTADTTTGNAPFTVQFTDTSTISPITGWGWNFGNGFSAFTQNPRFTYHEPGTYTVELIVTDEAGTVYRVVAEDYIRVT